MVEKVPSMKGGGMYWFTDLTTPDNLFILPVLTSLTFLATVEVCILSTVFICYVVVKILVFFLKNIYIFQLNMQDGMEGNPMAKTMKKVSRFFGVMFVPFTIGFPKVCNCETTQVFK